LRSNTQTAIKAFGAEPVPMSARSSTLAQGFASLLDGDPADRGRRAWSTVALMVGGIAISRGMTDGGESKAAAIEAARRPTDVGPDARGDGTSPTS
jgi:hypothetical protein